MKPIKNIEDVLREELEKIAWKHYNPKASINVEDMLDEMIPVIRTSFTSLMSAIQEEIREEKTKCGTTKEYFPITDAHQIDIDIIEKYKTK